MYLAEIPAHVSLRDNLGLQELGQAARPSYALVKVNPEIDLADPDGQARILGQHPQAFYFELSRSNQYTDPHTNFSKLPEELQPYQADELSAAAPPERGYWRAGQRVWASGAALEGDGAVAGWVCVEGGWPGRWRAITLGIKSDDDRAPMTIDPVADAALGQPAFAPVAAENRTATASVRPNTGNKLLDASGLPLVPMGYYSAEPLSESATNIREFKLGPNAVMPILSDLMSWQPLGPLAGDCHQGVCGWELLERWLSRADRVGSSVFFPLQRQFASLRGNETCPLGSGTPCLEAITTLIARVRHHRSIVSWYLADEPDGGLSNLSAANREKTQHGAAVLGQVYAHVKARDPRPTAICLDSTPSYLTPDRHNFPVFLPFADILLADIYPISHHWRNGLSVAYGVQLLRNHTNAPIYLVPQAFGGTECYPREPSPTEERLMVYLSWIHGASGIMWFQHEDPLEITMDGGAEKHMRFPSSQNLWAECRRLSIEGTELTSALTSNRSDAPSVAVSNASVHAVALVERRGGGVVVLLANTANDPVSVRLTLRGGNVELSDGHAAVLFSDRNVTVKGGVMMDTVDALGTRAYRLSVRIPPETGAHGPSPQIDPLNLLSNPSFENAVGGGGVPDDFWATTRYRQANNTASHRDDDASFFQDSRDSVHGLHSLRIHTVDEGRGLVFTHAMCPNIGFPLNASTQYTLSVWARGIGFNSSAAVLSIGLGQQGPNTRWLQPGNGRSFTLTADWARYSVPVRAPAAGCMEGRCLRDSGCLVGWSLETVGVAWLDLMELVPAHQDITPTEPGTAAVPPAASLQLPAQHQREEQTIETAGRSRAQQTTFPRIRDTLGLPVFPMGYMTHEQPTLDSEPMRSLRLGMNTGFSYLPDNQTAVTAWLDRCDAVGANVVM